ncbi:MAG: GTPase Era [Omnitrophica WOR_2 bacterium RIFCSPHIGHO2_02_FULL_50_17]|nr:MAG: GTPase Era [Omnitrophica WOR_2 bacterium RIFCSPHIGHO2_02_FULL_50_17]
MAEEKRTLKENRLRCGVVTIVGRPNTGKSTLLNRILKEKVAIVSRVPQTTRHQIRGIYNDERGQIIFIDTPGLHVGRDQLDKFMNQASGATLHEADCVIYLVDTSRRIGEEENYAVDKLKSVQAPLILALNKVDLKGEYLPDYISLWEKAKGQSVNEMKNFTLLPLSSQEGINVEKLIDILFDYLPEGPALYPVDTVSDVPQKMVIADIIREKFFELMKQEIPHALGVMIEEMQPRRQKVVYIKALILVERESQKEIVIGKQGAVLKNVGTLARAELEDLLEAKVFLELYVKVQKDWRDNAAFLRESGYEGR